MSRRERCSRAAAPFAWPASWGVSTRRLSRRVLFRQPHTFQHISTQTVFCFLSRKLQTLAVKYCRRIPLARFPSTAAIQQRNRCVRILCSERACAVALHQPRRVEAAAADIPVIQNTIRESRRTAPILQPLNDFQRPCTQDRGAAHHTRWVDARLLPAASAAHMGGSGTGRHWHHWQAPAGGAAARAGRWATRAKWTRLRWSRRLRPRCA